MSGKTVHFLLVYDHQTRELVSADEYSEGPAASRAYSDAEQRHGEDDHLEIVLVGADSIETIRKTHASYFIDEEKFSRFLVND